MEFLKRENNIKMSKSVVKVDKLQKYKEYILTELDEYIYENIKDVTDDEIKNYFNSADSFLLTYDKCSVKYNKDKNCFLIEYYINSKFSKEEFYQYTVNDKVIVYGCIDYSYKEGVLK